MREPALTVLVKVDAAVVVGVVLDIVVVVFVVVVVVVARDAVDEGGRELGAPVPAAGSFWA